MKIILISSILLFSCSSLAHKEQLNIFNLTISLNSDCQLQLDASEKHHSYSPKFSSKGECRIVSYSSTDIPHTKYINGAYILFIENNIKTASGCTSEYTAFGISKSNELLVTDLIKRSGSCYQDKELSSFEYYSARLKKH